MKKTLQNIIFAVFLVAGIVCSLTMLTARVCAEERCASAAFAIELKSVQRLAAADGRSAEDWLSDLSAAGVGYLIGTDETEAEAKALCARFGMAFARSGNAAKAGDAFLLPPTGEGKEIAAFSAAEFDSAVPIALVENLSRTGVLMPESFSPEAWPGPMVKTMYMYEKYSVCDEFGSAAENENILFRGVMDRGLRLVILTPLELSDGALNTDPTVYQTMLHSLGVRLQTRGIQTAETFSALDAPQRSAPLLFGAALLLIAAAVKLLGLLIPQAKRFELIFFLLALLADIGGVLLFPALLQTLAALAGAVVGPCYAAVLLCKRMKGDRRPMAAQMLLSLAEMLLIGLACGAFVGSVLATREYMLGFAVFRGVKLAMALPLLVGFALLLLTALPKRKQNLENGKLPKAIWVIAVLAVAAAAVILLLRSGDTSLPIPQLELDVRNFLEHTLYARPRTKEMLLAYPAIALFLVACRQRSYLLAVPFGLAAQLAAVSVTNTFCHIYTPAKVSFLRSLLGVGFGLVFGMIALGLLLLLFRKRQN